MPMSFPRRGILLITLACFVLAFFGLTFWYHAKTDEYATAEAGKLALNALLVHRATHAYVTQTQRPEIYRLKSEGKLYADYFSPKVMSFTYISRSIKELLNVQRRQYGLEDIYFKLASNNPRNPINRADALESQLLARMNRGELDRYQDVVRIDGKRYLYLAVPIERSNAGCMRCHGNPADAPSELVAMYGDKAGFHERPDMIRALISIRVPMRAIAEDANRVANALTLGTLLVMTAIYLLIAFFIIRLDAQRILILAKNRELEELSVTDSLTRALNRHGISRRLQEESSRANRAGLGLGVLMLDLDHFKAINDRHGHGVGDQVLVRFAEVIRRNLRVSDIFGRWGGEEFLVLVPAPDVESLPALAEKLRAAIAVTHFHADVRLTVSVGLTWYQPGESTADFINRVDKALYAAKQAGRDRVVALAAPAP